MLTFNTKVQKKRKKKIIHVERLLVRSAYLRHLEIARNKEWQKLSILPHSRNHYISQQPGRWGCTSLSQPCNSSC
jgi:hypothetical protein